MAKQTPKTASESVLELEKLVRKVIRVAFKDNTLDYNVQISTSSVEPETVKYSFMINGLKKEIQPIAMSYASFAECKAVLEELVKEINPKKVEQMFHQGRINVYNNAILSHQERLAEMDKEDEDDDGIVMEEIKHEE